MKIVKVYAKDFGALECAESRNDPQRDCSDLLVLAGERCYKSLTHKDKHKRKK